MDLNNYNNKKKLTPRQKELRKWRRYLIQSEEKLNLSDKGGNFTPEEKAEFLNYMAEGIPMWTALQNMSRSPHTLTNAEETDPEFAACVKKLKANHTLQVERALLESALGLATKYTTTYKAVLDHGKPVFNPDGSNQMYLAKNERQVLPPSEEAQKLWLYGYAPETYKSPVATGPTLDPNTPDQIREAMMERYKDIQAKSPPTDQ